MILSDIIIFAIIGIYLVRGLSKGFLMSVANLCGAIVGFLGALISAKMFAEPVANTIIMPLFGKIIRQNAHSAMGIDKVSVETAEIFAAVSEKASDILMKLGISDASALEAISNPIEYLVDGFTRIASQSIAFLIIFVIMFIVNNCY